MKKIIALLLALVMVLALAACGGQAAPADQPAAESGEGKVFNIYAWNEEFKGFFEKYYTVPEGVTVNCRPQRGQRLSGRPGRGSAGAG